MLGMFEEEQEDHCIFIEMSREHSGRVSGDRGIQVRWEDTYYGLTLFIKCLLCGHRNGKSIKILFYLIFTSLWGSYYHPTPLPVMNLRHRIVF